MRAIGLVLADVMADVRDRMVQAAVEGRASGNGAADRGGADQPHAPDSREEEASGAMGKRRTRSGDQWTVRKPGKGTGTEAPASDREVGGRTSGFQGQESMKQTRSGFMPLGMRQDAASPTRQCPASAASCRMARGVH